MARGRYFARNPRSAVPLGWATIPPTKEGLHVLRFPSLFLLLALIAGALGFGGLAGGLAEFFKTLFFCLLGLAVLGCVFNRTRESIDPMDRDLEAGSEPTIRIGK